MGLTPRYRLLVVWAPTTVSPRPISLWHPSSCAQPFHAAVAITLAESVVDHHQLCRHLPSYRVRVCGPRFCALGETLTSRRGSLYSKERSVGYPTNGIRFPTAFPLGARFGQRITASVVSLDNCFYAQNPPPAVLLSSSPTSWSIAIGQVLCAYRIESSRFCNGDDKSSSLSCTNCER